VWIAAGGIGPVFEAADDGELEGTGTLADV